MDKTHKCFRIYVHLWHCFIESHIGLLHNPTAHYGFNTFLELVFADR